MLENLDLAVRGRSLGRGEGESDEGDGGGRGLDLGDKWKIGRWIEEV